MFNLFEALEAVQGHDEFVVKTYDGLVCLDYILCFPGTFDYSKEEVAARAKTLGSVAEGDGEWVRAEADCKRFANLRRNFRGVTFDQVTGEIVSLPLHKFFNIGQTPETMFNALSHCRATIYEKVDGCLDGKTPIEFCDGSKHPISEIVKNQLQGPIWGCIDGEIVPTMISAWHNNGLSDDWLTVEVADRHNGKGKRSIACTPNHQCLTSDGYLEASKVRPGHQMFLNRVRFNAIQQSVIFGSLLGDMSLLDNGGLCLQWRHKIAHKSLSDFKSKILMPFHTTRRIQIGGFGTYQEHCTVHAAVPLHQVASRTYSGGKMVTRQWLDAIDDIGLAVWYMDDGSLSSGAKNQRPRATLHVEGFSPEEIDAIFQWLSERYGYTPVRQYYRGYTCLRLNADDAAAFWSRIAKYVIPEMRYKLPTEHVNISCFWDDYKPSPLCREVELVEVKRIFKGSFWRCGKPTTKFDITTETGNFFANGICVHNSMIHFFVHPVRDELQAATCRSTQTPQAQEALGLAKKNPLVFDRIHAIIGEGWTPVFEFVAAHNQIVVQYPRPRLVYLISRHRKTGEYKFHEGFPDTAQSYQFPFQDVNSMLDRQEFEGYVCHLDNGMIVKAKTPWYMDRHRAVDALMRPAYKLYQVVFDGVMDDLLPMAPDRFKPRLNAIYEEAQRDLLAQKNRHDATFEDCLKACVGSPGYPMADVVLPGRKNCKPLRKDFAQYVQANHKADFHVLMALFVGNDPSPYVKERLMGIYKTKYPNRLFADLEESA